MIDVTATMLPSTVMNDRSLADQIASRAIRADSAKLRIGLVGRGGPGRLVRFARSPRGEAFGRTIRVGVCGRPTYLTHPAHLSYLPFFALLSTFTRSPSAMPRTELYGPVIT